ncbi:MAG: SHD1 domain-containing protein [Planctomycetota bacterium]
MRNHPITRLCVVLILSICAATALARTWTDSTGTHKVEGEFVKMAEGTVDIRRTDGQLLHIPLEKLSEADQAFVRHVAKPIAKETPSVAAAPDERPASTAKPAAASGDAKDTQTVFAEGVGSTKEEALKDAFRAAVRQVVGEAVDAETIVKNEELVRDQVLTYSDGFIPEHKVTSEKRDNGLFRVGILAKVQRRSVIMKLKAANVTAKSFDGQSVYGSIVTEIAAEKDAAALVAKALEDFPGNYVEASVVGPPKTLAKSDSEVTLAFNVEFVPSIDAYNAFATRFCRTLRGISKSSGEFTSVIQASDKSKALYVRSEQFDHVCVGWAPKLAGWDSGRGLRWKFDGFAFVVAKSVSKDYSRISWNYFVLDAAVRDAAVRAASRSVICKLSLVDSGGQLLFTDPFDPKSAPIFRLDDDQYSHNNEWGRFLSLTMNDEHYRYGDERAKVAFIAPVVFAGPGHYRGPWPPFGYVPNVTIPRKVKLSLDELRKVAKVKCELTFQAEDGDGDKSARGRASVRGGKK